MKVVSIVGMAGAGKSEVARMFAENGFIRIRFGDATDDEVRRRGLELNETNERAVRESLRAVHGMDAYARLNRPRIDDAVRDSDVVIDGLYSWEEYVFLKDCYGDGLRQVAVWASPTTRHTRLAGRRLRGLTGAEAMARDRSEIENSNKGGPIAIADHIIINESSLEELARQTAGVIERIGGQVAAT
jgi:dephospho-CoA kinase